MITNICPRCKSEKLNFREDKFFGCQDCGKTGKSYEVWVRFDLDGEAHATRNIMREMAGTLAEYSAPSLAIGLVRVLEHYKTTVSPSIAQEIISRVVAEAFHTMYQMAVPFLPPDIQEATQRLADLVQREQEAEQRKENDGEPEQSGGGAPDLGGVPGEPGGGPDEKALSVPASVDGGEQGGPGVSGA
jgi:hypothetical protein